MSEKHDDAVFPHKVTGCVKSAPEEEKMSTLNFCTVSENKFSKTRLGVLYSLVLKNSDFVKSKLIMNVHVLFV